MKSLFMRMCVCMQKHIHLEAACMKPVSEVKTKQLKSVKDDNKTIEDESQRTNVFGCVAWLGSLYWQRVGTIRQSAA